MGMFGALAGVLMVFEIPLLVHHMTAVGAEQQAGEQAHIIVAIGAFALLA